MNCSGVSQKLKNCNGTYPKTLLKILLSLYVSRFPCLWSVCLLTVTNAHFYSSTIAWYDMIWTIKHSCRVWNKRVPWVLVNLCFTGVKLEKDQNHQVEVFQVMNWSIPLWRARRDTWNRVLVHPNWSPDDKVTPSGRLQMGFQSSPE
jgi:hypothetical protein